MNHWAVPYIGIPWAYGATGPDAFDCWNFVCHIQKTHFSIEMPKVDYNRDWHVAADHLANHEERQKWVRTELPLEGDVVMMARSRLPIHIGVFINANRTRGILHCADHQGVVFNPLGTLVGAGWGRLQYYRRAPHA